MVKTHAWYRSMKDEELMAKIWLRLCHLALAAGLLMLLFVPGASAVQDFVTEAKYTWPPFADGNDLYVLDTMENAQQYRQLLQSCPSSGVHFFSTCTSEVSVVVRHYRTRAHSHKQRTCQGLTYKCTTEQHHTAAPYSDVYVQ